MIPNMWPRSHGWFCIVCIPRCSAHCQRHCGDSWWPSGCKRQPGSNRSQQCFGEGNSVVKLWIVVGKSHICFIKSCVPVPVNWCRLPLSFKIQKIRRKINIFAHDQTSRSFGWNSVPVHWTDVKLAFRGMALKNPGTTSSNIESCNNHYGELATVKNTWTKWQITGRNNTGLSDYYGSRRCERVIIAMGPRTKSSGEAYNNNFGKSVNGEKVGMVAVQFVVVRLQVKHFLAAVPKTAKKNVKSWIKSQNWVLNGEPSTWR